MSMGGHLSIHFSPTRIGLPVVGDFLGPFVIFK